MAFIYNISPFDATQSFDLSFSYTGGNQSYYNRLCIQLDDTLETVYDEKIQTLQLKHTIPANTLDNGERYVAKIYVYDVDDKLVDSSQDQYFLCLSTPSWSFTNLINNQIIQNDKYTTILSYSQNEGEELQSFQVIVYNMSKEVLHSSGTIYDTENLSYTISNLDDNGQYYIRGTGETINGIELDTNYILVTVDYIVPSQWYLVELSNESDIGAIQIRSNIVTLEGTCSIDPPPFVDDTFIDLSEEGANVKFEEGFTMQGDGTLAMSVKELQRNKIFFIANNDSSTLTLEYKIGSFLSTNNEDVCFIVLKVYNPITYYTVRSTYLPLPTDNSIFHIAILKQGQLYDLIAHY